MRTAEAYLALLLTSGLFVACGGKSDGAASGAGGTGGAPTPDSGPIATMADGVTCKSMAFRHMIGANKVCVCQPGTPTACDTACVDLTLDDDNCGACGHACAPQSTCNAGVCGPLPTTAVAAPAACGPMRLAAAGGTLYWTDTMNGKVMKMPAAGGAPTPISGAETTSPTLLSIQGTTVFWLDGKTIRKNAGGAIAEVIASADDVHGLAISDDATTVYFSSASRIQSVSAAGGEPADVALQDLGAIPSALAVQGSLMAFPVDIDGGVDIIQLGTDIAHCWSQDVSLDVNCDRISEGQGSLLVSVILIGGAHVFWVDGNNVKMNALSATAVNSNATFASADNPVHAIAYGGGEVFFAEYDETAPSTGTVQKVAAVQVATPVVPLARNVNGPGSVAVAGGKVFWSTLDCEIQTTPTGD